MWNKMKHHSLSAEEGLCYKESVLCEGQTIVLGSSILFTSSSDFSCPSGLQAILSLSDLRGQQCCRCIVAFSVIFSSLFAVWHKYLVHCKANTKQWKRKEERNSNRDYAILTWVTLLYEKFKPQMWKALYDHRENNGLILACVKAFS